MARQSLAAGHPSNHVEFEPVDSPPSFYPSIPIVQLSVYICARRTDLTCAPENRVYRNWLTSDKFVLSRRGRAAASPLREPRDLIRKDDYLTRPDWKLYERITAAIMAENEGIEMSTTPNARIIGSISGTPRQIDVLINARWGDDVSRRMIVDAKRYRGKVDIKDVEAFEAMMRDCRAQRGIIVCPNGWTNGARRRSQDAITIMPLPLENVEAGTWSAHFDACLGPCEDQKRTAGNGLVLWHAQHLLGIESLWAVIHTGKCDACHSYHVWCWDCGCQFALGDDDTYECTCGRFWASLIEEDFDDPSGTTLNAVHLILLVGDTPIVLDRRMLR
jgi:Restriction endonuclease